jgi:hypothetical protein
MADKFKPGYRWRTLIKGAEGFEYYNDDKERYLKTYFDELVIDDWFHIERVDDISYYIRVGDYRVDIKFSGSEKPEVYVEKE